MSLSRLAVDAFLNYASPEMTKRKNQIHDDEF